MKALLIAVLLLAGCTKAEYISAPAKACTSYATGKTDTYVTLQCMMVGSNPCGMQIPITHEQREVVITCTWREMQ